MGKSDRAWWWFLEKNGENNGKMGWENNGIMVGKQWEKGGKIWDNGGKTPGKHWEKTPGKNTGKTAGKQRDNSGKNAGITGEENGINTRKNWDNGQ